MTTDHADLDVATLEAVAAQLNLRWKQYEKEGTRSPEFVSGFFEALGTVNHIWGETAARQTARERARKIPGIY